MYSGPVVSHLPSLNFLLTLLLLFYVCQAKTYLAAQDEAPVAQHVV